MKFDCGDFECMCGFHHCDAYFGTVPTSLARKYTAFLRYHRSKVRSCVRLTAVVGVRDSGGRRTLVFTALDSTFVLWSALPKRLHHHILRGHFRNERNERKRTKTRTNDEKMETDRSHSILSQIEKCQWKFNPIIHQMNISAIIF